MQWLWHNTRVAHLMNKIVYDLGSRHVLSLSVAQLNTLYNMPRKITATYGMRKKSFWNAEEEKLTKLMKWPHEQRMSGVAKLLYLIKYFIEFLILLLLQYAPPHLCY